MIQFLEWVVTYNEGLFLKILLGVLIAGVIGFDRERNGMMVGIRTHILVCLCAIMLQITSLSYFGSTGDGGDVFRLGGQMLSGLGFLGAGTILKEDRKIRGLTTATSLFFIACVGLTIGTGQYFVAIFVSIVGYTFLKDILGVKNFVKDRSNSKICVCVETSSQYQSVYTEIKNMISNIGAEIDSINIEKISCDKMKLTLYIEMYDEDGNDVVNSLISLDVISKVELIR